MSYNPNIPNPSQSPGLFPAQSQANFTRLKTIINSDHVFNDSTQSTDGIHRQATMLVRDMPGSLPSGANAILYSWIDADGQSQLRYYNGTNDFQITPPGGGIGGGFIAGTVNLAGNTTSGTVWTIPANTFAWVFVNYTNPVSDLFTLYFVFCSGPSSVRATILRNSSIPFLDPTISFAGNNMRVRNNSDTLSDVSYYIMASVV